MSLYTGFSAGIGFSFFHLLGPSFRFSTLTGGFIQLLIFTNLLFPLKQNKIHVEDQANLK